MKKGKRNARISIRLSADEQQQLAEIYRMCGSTSTISTFARNILLGYVEHPLAPPSPGHVLDVKDSGALDGPYDSRIFYQSVIIAAEYLKIVKDPEYLDVIKANKPAFDKILRQIRGYEFDEKVAVKLPLNRNQ